MRQPDLSNGTVNSPDDIEQRHMLLLVLILSFSASIVMAVMGIDRPFMIGLAGVMLLSTGLAWRGRLLEAGMLAPLAAFLVFAYLIFYNNGLRDTSVLGLTLIIIAASLMTGWRGSLVFGVLGILCIAALWLAETQGWVVNKFSTENYPADYITVLLILALVTILQYAVLRRLDNTLLRVKKELARRQRASTALAESETRYRLLVTEAPLGILILGLDGLIEQANPAALQLLGFSEQEITYADPASLLDPAGLQTAGESAAEGGHPGGLQVAGLTSGQTIQSEHVLCCKDGARVPVMGSAKRMPDGRTLYIFQDIRLRKQAEADIRNLNQELERRVFERTAQLQAANQELEAFAFTVSHDLRAPLRAINGYATLLEDELHPSPDSESRTFLDNIRSSASRMDRLISALLQLSRLSRAPLGLSQVDAKALVAAVIAEHTYPERRIHWQIGELPGCIADAALLRQVFANLVANAIKYTGKQAEAYIEVGSYRIETETVYFVKDNGVGFDMAQAEKIFGVFQRLHAEHEFEGSGIGLAIVKRIVERHGGRVWCEACPEQGATFYFSLPNEMRL